MLKFFGLQSDFVEAGYCSPCVLCVSTFWMVSIVILVVALVLCVCTFLMISIIGFCLDSLLQCLQISHPCVGSITLAARRQMCRRLSNIPMCEECDLRRTTAEICTVLNSPLVLFMRILAFLFIKLKSGFSLQCPEMVCADFLVCFPARIRSGETLTFHV